MTSRRHHAGLSLVELLLVVALIAVAAGVAAATLGGGRAGAELRGAARTLAEELRYTRAQAIVSGREQVFRLDVDTRHWQAAGKRDGQLPASVTVTATTARNEQQARGDATVRFFPDGAATGGRYVLAHGDARWQVEVAWLTGEVTLQRGGATP